MIEPQLLDTARHSGPTMTTLDVDFEMDLSVLLTPCGNAASTTYPMILLTSFIQNQRRLSPWPKLTECRSGGIMSDLSPLREPASSLAAMFFAINFAVQMIGMAF
jgi:hypothetical protein